MPKRPQYIALSFVLFLVLVTANLPAQTATQVKLVLGGFFLPLFGLTSSARSLVHQVDTSLTPKRALIAELEQLRREKQQFRIREVQAAEVLRENEHLRQALRLQKQIPGNSQYARVILRDPANWWRTLQIDVGRRDGVVSDLPVLTPEGTLAGRTKDVGYSSARVALVGDPDCRVSAMVEDTNLREYGVVASGTASILDPSLVDLTWVNNRQTAIKPGQRVLTSGLGGVFPPGFLIGHVIDANSVGFGLYTEARVKLAANLANLEEVWVILR
jgi:rod shape-determining protein MreC